MSGDTLPDRSDRMSLGCIELQRQTDSKAMPASSTMMELLATNTDWSTQHRAPD